MRTGTRGLPYRIEYSSGKTFEACLWCEENIDLRMVDWMTDLETIDDIVSGNFQLVPVMYFVDAGHATLFKLRFA